MKRIFGVTAAAALLVYQVVRADPGADHEHEHGDHGHVHISADPAAAVNANRVQVTERDGFRTISSNGLPDHATGRFPTRDNPNRISEQDHRFRVTLTPQPADDWTPNRMNVFGVAINGIPFDPATAEFWRNQRGSIWNKEAFNGRGVGELGMDHSNAHVQPNGTYHYHGIPLGLVGNIKAKMDKPGMIFVGWAADGYPIYSQFGYKDPSDPASGLVELKPSYRLKQGTRPAGPGSNEGPGGRYDGTYTVDYEYVEGLGDLDKANGRTGVTPEFPDGTYYYVLTDSFPRVPRYWRGEPDRSFMKGPGAAPGSGPGSGQGSGQGNGPPDGRRGPAPGSGPGGGPPPDRRPPQ